MSVLHLFVCENLRLEIEKLLSEGSLPDVVPVFFPARCGRPPLAPTELALFAGVQSLPTRGLILGSACVAGQEGFQGLRLQRLEHCLYPIAGPSLVTHYVKQGAYLVSPGWLARWPVRVAEWGEDRDAIRMMFAESIRKVVLLDTGVLPDSQRLLGDLSEYLGLPAEQVCIGLDHMSLWLAHAVSSLETEPAGMRAASDYAMALDLLGELPRAQSEEGVVKRIADVFRMFFAPTHIHYLSLNEDHPGFVWSFPPVADPEKVRERLAAVSLEASKTESGRGLRLRIGPEAHPVGVIEAESVAFPEQLTHYLNLATAISRVVYLAVENTRAYEQQRHLVAALQKALAEVRVLQGLLPICANCKKIRDDKGAWLPVEIYVQDRSEVQFSHGICPDCFRTLYPEFL